MIPSMAFTVITRRSAPPDAAQRRASNHAAGFA
jgi:hypothetical protein